MLGWSRQRREVRRAVWARMRDLKLCELEAEAEAGENPGEASHPRAGPVKWKVGGMPGGALGDSLLEETVPSGPC